MLTVSRLSSKEAAILVDAATDKAREIGVPMCIAVTDEAGDLVAFTRMDTAKVSSISISIDKASTAATARNPTSFYNQICVPGQPTFGIHVSNGGHFCVIGGGVPVVVDGVVVGGLGLSAGTAAQDVVCAEAALAVFYEKTGHKAERKA